LKNLQWTFLTLKYLSKLAQKSPYKKPPMYVVVEATGASQHEFVYCEVLSVRNKYAVLF
jgi:hypothetical protein